MSLRHLPLALSVLLTATSCVVSVPVATQEPYTDDGRPVFTQGQGTRNPIIQSFTANPTSITQGQAITFQVVAHDPDRQPLQFNWSATDGTLSTNTGQVVSWIPPAKPGTYSVMVTVANGRGGFATGAHNLVVQADGSAKIGVTPVASAAPIVLISPSAVPPASQPPVISPTAAPSIAPSPMASASPDVTPPPLKARPATVTTVTGIDAGTENTRVLNAYYMKALPGTSALYFPTLQIAPFLSQVGTVDDAKHITFSATSISGKAYNFAFVGSELYYMTDTHIGKPDGSLLPFPGDLLPWNLEVAGRHAYFKSRKWNCLYRMDLDTGATTIFAGQMGVSGHRNGMGTEAQFSNIIGMTYNPVAKALFVVDNTRIRKVTLAGEVSDFVGQDGTVKVAPKDGKGSAAALHSPLGITADDAGNLFFTETTGGYVRHVASDGEVTTIAGNGRGLVLIKDGIGDSASFQFARAITFGRHNGKPALFVADADRLRIVTDWQ